MGQIFEIKSSIFGFENLIYTSSVEQSKKINSIKEPIIIISSSGMCEAGRILHHLKNNVEDSRNTILIIGFMAEHTLGRRIADREKKIKIFGEEYELNAQVKILNEFSAHADYKEITEHIKKMNVKSIKKIFLVHGEKKAQEHLKTYLHENTNIPVQIVKIKEKYQL
jgi:metallo-beta-lactamase family protein